MKIAFISDTHGQHEFLSLPSDIDMLIHCGDVCNRGTEIETFHFIKWFNELDIKHKIFIAGNHDFYLEKLPDHVIRALLKPGTYYLNDSGITIEGIKIWGSPVQPWFFNWAFNRQRGTEIRKHWNMVPTDTDILITHGPPKDILDKTQSGENVGCKDLLLCTQIVLPKIHAFGHIHEAYGEHKTQRTLFLNACVLNERYHLVNDPVIFNW